MATLNVCINLPFSSFLTLIPYGSITPFFYFMDWTCKELFIFFTPHSPMSSFNYAYFGSKLWMKSPTLCFLIHTQHVVMENILGATWTTRYYLLLELPLFLLFYQQSILTNIPLKRFRLVEFGFASPRKMPQDGLSFHGMNIPLITNVWHLDGLSYCNNDKEGVSYLMQTSCFFVSMFQLICLPLLLCVSVG